MDLKVDIEGSNTDGIDYPTDSRYYNLYQYGSEHTIYNYLIGQLGDATREVTKSGDTTGLGLWYLDYAHFPYSSYPWFRRGGVRNVGANAGVFDFRNERSNIGTADSFRVVLAY